MDVILELTDTYVWDYMYAFFLPAPPAPYDFPGKVLANATAVPTWQYKPATAYFSLQPSEAAWQSAWARDNIYRQGFSLFLILWLFGLLNYFVFAGFSYLFVFDKKTFDHPKFLKNQVWLEIKQANSAMPGMALLTAPIMLAEVRGFGMLYDKFEEAPAPWYNWFQFPLFLLFTDFAIYWIHRGLHHPWVYKHLHKPHHKWIMPTPFASHAFHPLDGYAQSLPYHVFPFIFPLQKLAYVGLFIFINFWTIMIHDGEYIANNPIINGAACHSVHHLAFNYNYGQYFTLWDRIGGSYREPEEEMFKKDVKMNKKYWEKEVKVMEAILQEVEGEDDREYGPVETKKSK
ncbi:putative C-5 sterol desaturase [Cladorrhinum sp. PSN259]|nr:putative C-5 sterol desaturase [Cladorrhinum sp. PSN259]